jgi:hypothetical protein
MNELYGGARISYIFHDIFARALEDVNPFDGLTDQVHCDVVHVIFIAYYVSSNLCVV